jgi:hypothetical protein
MGWIQVLYLFDPATCRKTAHDDRLMLRHDLLCGHAKSTSGGNANNYIAAALDACDDFLEEVS